MSLPLPLSWQCRLRTCLPARSRHLERISFRPVITRHHPTMPRQNHYPASISAMSSLLNDSSILSHDYHESGTCDQTGRRKYHRHCLELLLFDSTDHPAIVIISNGPLQIRCRRYQLPSTRHLLHHSRLHSNGVRRECTRFRAASITMDVRHYHHCSKIASARFLISLDGMLLYKSPSSHRSVLARHFRVGRECSSSSASISAIIISFDRSIHPAFSFWMSTRSRIETHAVQ